LPQEEKKLTAKVYEDERFMKRHKDERWETSSHVLQKNQKPWSAKGESRAIQLVCTFNIVFQNGEKHNGVVGYTSPEYNIRLTPQLLDFMEDDCRISAGKRCAQERSDEPLDVASCETTSRKIYYFRSLKPLKNGARHSPQKEPGFYKPKVNSTGIKTARNGRRYIPLRRDGLNYAWRDIKTGVVYSNGTFVRILNKEGADSSKAKPIKVKKND
jgi:hypothetical protein